LYELRFDHVFLAAFRATGRGEDFCLDVVQETFLRVMRAGGRVGRIRDEGHADRWLIAVARSVALDLLRVERRRGRRERRAARREAEMGGAASGGDDTVIAALQAELDRLPSDDRELLHLRTSGMTLAAIAEIVGASVGSVHGRLRRLTGVLGRSQEESK
jgi:RNA polymerase sigma factor (sigma-70 family)